MVSEKHLHILSFDVPYPPDYGGVIDVYYKMKAFADQGIHVHLHCYQYGREAAKQLEEICDEVIYYKRKIYKDPFFSKDPYIVITRNSGEILDNLRKDDYPIFFEGLHSCYYLNSEILHNRFKVVRMHNIEHVYYKNLAKIEKNLFKKYFFNTEANRLRKFEKHLKKANLTAAISPADHQYLNLKYQNSFYLPVFHSNTQVEVLPGKGDFVLYHGNLSVGENNEAAIYLIREIFNDLEIPLYIAGMNPSSELIKAAAENPGVKLFSKLNNQEIHNLIQKAQINILHTQQNTGIKLKLVNVLFNGRFCIVNPKMVEATGLEDLCIVAPTKQKMKAFVQEYFEKEFPHEEITKRKCVLESNFNNERNTKLIIDKINFN